MRKYTFANRSRLRMGLLTYCRMDPPSSQSRTSQRRVSAGIHPTSHDPEAGPPRWAALWVT